MSMDAQHEEFVGSNDSTPAVTDTAPVATQLSTAAVAINADAGDVLAPKELSSLSSDTLKLPIDAIKLAPAGGGAPVTLTKDAADLCVFLRHAVEDTTDGAPIPVPFDRTTCELVARLLEAFVKRHDELDTKPTFRAALPDTLANSHCGSLAAGDALQLANAANFFGSDALAGVAGSRLAQLVVQCSSADEVCVRFKIECDMSPEERTAVLTELPWTPSSSTVVQQGPVGQFGDAVDCVFKCLEESPPVLLWLKGVSSGWCNHIRERICSLGWAVRQGLQTDWVEGARALSGNPRVLQGFDILLTVTMLNLARCGITTLEAKGVAAMMVFSKSLTTINLERNRLGPVGGKAIADAISVSKSLTEIYLGGNNLGPEGAKALGQAISVSKSLKECDLRANQLGEVGWCAVFDVLRDNPQNMIAKWELADQRIDSEIAKSLAAYMAVSKSLTSIDLAYNELEAEVAKALGPAISVSKSLTSINLSLNQLEAEAAKALGPAISVSKSLTSVDLSFNKLGAEGAKPIAEAITVSKSLTSIDLSINNLGAEGIMAIAEAVSVSKSLTEINLRNNRLGSEGAKALGPSISVSKSLTSINLSYNNLGSEGGKAIAQGISVSKSLTSIDLSDNGLDEATEAALRAAGSKLIELEL